MARLMSKRLQGCAGHDDVDPWLGSLIIASWGEIQGGCAMRDVAWLSHESAGARDQVAPRQGAMCMRFFC